MDSGKEQRQKEFVHDSSVLDNVFFFFLRMPVIWGELGKDLGENLENPLIVFLRREAENVKTKKEARRMKQKQVYVLDLTKIDGNGDFSCPRCGTAISPDDCTEKAYSIMETKVNSHGLEELVIRCNKCESQLHLTGFSLLQKLSEVDEKESEKKREETLCYITHV
jgi:predicted RNA-binding Zn-ribbon protein involved in translation (DUF1610 family)